MSFKFCSLLISLYLFCFTPIKIPGAVNELRLNGYSLIPTPQKAELTGRDISIDNSWGIQKASEQGLFAKQ